MSADTDQQPDPDSFSFQEEDFETIPWSANYVLVCMLLPALCGGLSSFAWAGFTLYVRSQGWDLQIAGVLVSAGGLGRLVTQQALLRLGLWSSVLLTLLHLAFATLGLIFLDQAWAVFGEIAAMIAFDVTVAIEGVTFEVWSDSEVMVAQAQSTVLSVFTLSYAIAATLGGVLYDAASWKGCAIYHVACLVLQVLALAIQPAVLESFREFLGGAAARTVDGTDDAVQPFSGATAIVPAADEFQRVQSPESESAARSFDLPGAVESGSPRQSADNVDVVDPTPLRGANEVEATPERGRAGSASAAGGVLEPNVRRSGGSHASSRRPTLRSRLTTRTAQTHRTTGSGQTAHTARSGRSNMTRQTAQTSGTLATAMTGLSRFTRLTEAGQNFEFHYGVTNALRPNIASNTVTVNLDGVAEEYGNRKSGASEEEPQVAEQKNGGKLPRDLYLPAFVIMLSSFNNNASYGVEWSTFAIFFKEQHGWESATWAGICQTAGDLLAAVIMAVAGKPTRADLSECPTDQGQACHN
ncbi:unnamed protein product [Durusdinium trenchii]|uniref:Solute carrier family 40 protein n=1 Tax=Durusdinium trenchii TaxID=1381693 RepID=A0ABP0SYF7_9DINO